MTAPIIFREIETNIGLIRLANLTQNMNYLPIIQQAFQNSSRAFDKLTARNDRTCELMFSKDKLLGFLIYKNQLQNECYGYSIKNSLELKALKIIEPENVGRGYRTTLFNRVLEVAKEKQAESVHVMISGIFGQEKEFFIRKKFQSVHTWNENDKVKNLFKLNVSNPSLILKKRTIDQISSEENKETPSNRETKRVRSDSDPSIGERKNKEKKRRRKSLNLQKRIPSMSSEQAQIHQVKTHAITLRKQYIHAIQNGKKTIEGRINSGMMLRLKTNDRVRFYYQQDPSDDVTCQITDIKRFDTFKAMLEDSGYKNCVPDATSLENAVNIYEMIPGYNERARKSGVLAIHLKKIEKN